MYEDSRERCLKAIEDAKEACNRNPNDSKTWKDWAETLIDIIGASEDEEKDKEYLKDAIKKLEKAVEVDGSDYDALWKLGEAIMYTPWVDNHFGFNRDLYMEYCVKALQCFVAVRKVKPEHGKESHMPVKALQAIENFKRLAQARVTQEIESPEVEVTEVDEIPEEVNETETSSNGEKFGNNWNKVDWKHEYYQKKLMELVHSTKEPTATRHLEVMWAQRPDKVYLTVMLADAKDAKVNLETDQKFIFTANAGLDNNAYEIKLDLFDKVSVEKNITITSFGGRGIECVIEKANVKWWKKLLNGDGKAPHYVKVDWEKWIDEDDDGPAAPSGDMDRFGGGGRGGCGRHDGSHGRHV